MAQGNEEQWEIMDNAYQVFLERNARYKDLWQGDGVYGCLDLARHKFLRVIHHADELQDAVVAGNHEKASQCQEHLEEDAVDAINYLCFVIRNARESRIVRPGV